MAVREIPELKNDILELKKRTGVTIVAHRYQDPDVIDVADACGDVIQMARAVSESPNQKALVCGVRCIAEVISMFCPEKEIILAHPQARCPMSGQIYPGRVRQFREEHPDTCIICMVSASTALKAECDLCVTEDNSFRVMSTSTAGKMLFLSDSNLGQCLRDMLPEKDIELWSCHCPALSGVSTDDVKLCRIKWPDAMIFANRQLSREVTLAADMCGSTAEIIEFCEKSDRDVVIADESNVCERLKRRFPEKGLFQLAPSKLLCNNMRLTALPTVERALKGEFGAVITASPEHCARAMLTLTRMLALSGEEWRTGASAR